MLGDTASRDADHPIDLSTRHPGQVQAIYIRQAKDIKNARRVAKLIEAHSDINAVLVHFSEEMLAHAAAQGWIQDD